MDEEKNILEILLDAENDDTIKLYDENDELVEFEQVAIVPLSENELYAILKPVDPDAMGIPEDEAMVFRIDFDEFGEPYLAVETDNEKSIAVFDVYYQLLDEAE